MRKAFKKVKILIMGPSRPCETRKTSTKNALFIIGTSREEVHDYFSNKIPGKYIVEKGTHFFKHYCVPKPSYYEYDYRLLIVVNYDFEKEEVK